MVTKHDSQKKLGDAVEEYKKFLATMNVGDSFFVENARPNSLEFLRRLAKRQGRTLAIRFVLQDQIYGKSGTRVYRVK
ncbi:hypothetical protein [Providencia phage PSTCR9]|nr:hypothetical protein [Providencia phage PSTCR9]